jgi:4-hydroxyphenylpyruvate dioxygenase
MSQNPAGLKNIDHLEFTVDSMESPTVKLFSTIGFVQTAISDDSRLYTQGQVRFLVKAAKDENHLARKYFKTHGEGVSKMSFQVESVEKALDITLKNGAKLIYDLKVEETAHGTTKTAAIQGFGDVVNEFVERPLNEFRPGFKSIDTDPSARPLTTRVSRIDHLTNNVPKGQMDHWVDFIKEPMVSLRQDILILKGQKPD